MILESLGSGLWQNLIGWYFREIGAHGSPESPAVLFRRLDSGGFEVLAETHTRFHPSFQSFIPCVLQQARSCISINKQEQPACDLDIFQDPYHMTDAGA